MIDKKISVSEQVANLSRDAQLVFTWSVPHADDIGVLPRSHRTLKAMVIPMWDCTIADLDTWVGEIVAQGLWREIEHGGQKFYLLAKFTDHQTLKKDRQPQTFLNITHDKDPKASWNALEEVLETLGIQLEDAGFQMGTEEKRSEENRREDRVRYRADVLEAWNAVKVIIHKTLSKDAQKEIDKLFGEKYTLADIKKAIALYATILQGKEYFWSYKWNLYEFLKRGLKKFEGKTPEDYLKSGSVTRETKADKI